MNDLSDAPNALRELSPIVFVNGAAGGNRTRRHLPQIQKLFASSHLDAKFVMTQSAAELESSARAAIAARHRLLLVMGGDGTFQALVNAAFGADVLLGVLPSGGGNDFAAALGVPSDPMKAAEAILRGKTRCVDLAKVRTAEGGTRLYAGGGGIGLDAEAARYASGPYRRLPGRFRYIASALLAAALNTPTYGAGVRLVPEAALNDGMLNIVMIEDLSKIGVLALLPRLMGSGELRTPRVKRWKARRVRITADRPSLFHGDGEILGATPVEIEVVENAVRVLAPGQH
jgi:diacylglycerol kinase (ATP)